MIQEDAFAHKQPHIYQLTTCVSLAIFQIIGLTQQELANLAIYPISGILTQMLVNHAQQLIFMILIKENAFALHQLNMLTQTINVFLVFPLDFGTLINFNALLVLLDSLILMVIAFVQLIDHT
jgi:hypothetical protein